MPLDLLYVEKRNLVELGITNKFINNLQAIKSAFVPEVLL